MARNTFRSNRRARVAVQSLAPSLPFDLAIIELAVLLGFAVGWLCASYVAMFAPIFVTTMPSFGVVVVAACLFAIALGIDLPRRAAAMVVHFSPRYTITDRRNGAAESNPGDRSLLRTVTAVVALSAGLCAAASPWEVRAGNWFYHAAIGGFFWIAPTHALLVVITVGIAALPAMTLIGVLKACLYRIAGNDQSSQLIPWMLCSAAAGVLAMATLRAIAPAALLAALSSVPLFIAAIVAIHDANKPDVGGHSVRRHDRATFVEHEAPTASKWTAAALCGFVTLAICTTDAASALQDSSSAGAPWMLAAMGLGWWVTSARVQPVEVIRRKAIRVAGLASIGGAAAVAALIGLGASAFWFTLVGAVVAAIGGRALRRELAAASGGFSSRCFQAAGVVMTTWAVVRLTPGVACILMTLAGLLVILATPRVAPLLTSSR